MKNPTAKLKVYTVKMKYGEPIVGTIRTAQYGDGSLAVQIWDGEGPETLSINLISYGLRAPEGHMFVKNYSEHEGLPDAIQEAGIATKIREVSIGYGSGWLMKLDDNLL